MISTLTLILDAAFAAIAVVLTVLSLKTIGTIKHLGIGKSFWVPVLLSGILFLTASTVTILNEMNIVSIMGLNEEIAQISQVVALTVLVVGVYSYSKTISKSLATKITLPARAIRETEETEEIEETAEEAQPRQVTRAPPPRQPIEPLPTIQERLIQEDQTRETETVFHGCQHQLGYLQTLPRNVPIPDECMTCDKIIECKHSITRTQERSATPPPENLADQNEETPQQDEMPSY